MIYIKKYYRKALIIGIPLVVLLILFLLFALKKEEDDNLEIIDNIGIDDLVVDKNANLEKPDYSYKFNIKGAVVNPGVYSFSEGDRVIDAIEKSGGLLENADTSVINLSKNLFDEMVIIIYTNEEVQEMKSSNVIIQYVEKECNCPSISNDACISNDDVNSSDNNIDNIVDNSNSNSNPSVSKKISINTATMEELQSLSGIGESKAKAIIKYREEHGSFNTIEDIMNVSGIGNAVFEKIKDSITV